MSRKTYVRTFLVVAILLIASALYSLPFYVSKPGMAKELEPIIEVSGGDEAKGSFMLTTVRMGRANIFLHDGEVEQISGALSGNLHQKRR